MQCDQSSPRDSCRPWRDTTQTTGDLASRPVKGAGRCLQAGLKNTRPCLPTPPGDGHSERRLSLLSFTPMKWTPGPMPYFVAGDNQFGSAGSLQDGEIANVSLAVASVCFCHLWIYGLFFSVPWMHFLNCKNVKKCHSTFSLIQNLLQQTSTPKKQKQNWLHPMLSSGKVKDTKIRFSIYFFLRDVKQEQDRQAKLIV